MTNQVLDDMWKPFDEANDSPNTWADYEDYEIETLRNVEVSIQLSNATNRPGGSEVNIVVFHEDNSRVLNLGELLPKCITYDSDDAEDRIVALTKLQAVIAGMIEQAKAEE